jgi:hypothetical protein
MHTTQKNLDIVATAGEVLLDLVLGNEAGTASPAGGRVVEYVEDSEPSRVSGGQVIQFNLEQDILWVDIGVDEVDDGFVLGVFKSSADDLEHGGDSGSTSDHSKLTRQVRGIDEFTLGALDPELVSNLEEGHVARDVTLLIGLETSE